jgi:hypothetical protein
MLKKEKISHIVHHLELFQLIRIKILSILLVLNLRESGILMVTGSRLVESRHGCRIVLVEVVGLLSWNQILSVEREVLRFGSFMWLIRLKGVLGAEMTLYSFWIIVDFSDYCLLFSQSWILILLTRSY